MHRRSAPALALAAVTTTVQARRASFIYRADGARLFYKDWGSGRSVLFVHGTGVTSECWSYQMTPLAARGFRCIAFDRRGHGRSSDIGQSSMQDTLANDIAAVVNVLDVRNVTLVAHAEEREEIERYLTRHGHERVSRVVMVDKE